MGKQVKWVIDNLGITRKEIHVYEAKGLIKKQGVKHDIPINSGQGEWREACIPFSAFERYFVSI